VNTLKCACTYGIQCCIGDLSILNSAGERDNVSSSQLKGSGQGGEGVHAGIQSSEVFVLVPSHSFEFCLLCEFLVVADHTDFLTEI
jgi:hypothetical protein